MEQYRNTEWIEYEAGLGRFAGRPELYHKYLRKFMEMPEFGALCTAMEEHRYQDAFAYAHTLKGNAGNLSLAKLYKQISKLTELLRGDADIDAAIRLLPEVRRTYEETISQINQMLA